MAHPDSVIARWVPAAGCLAASAAAALLLHTASARPDAWAMAPIAWAWGALALAGAWSLRDRSATPLAVVALAALIRLPLLGTPPLLSDDVFRYLWEGGALAAGHNPFLEPPAAIAGLDEALRARVNHPELPSIYPPLALWWFRLLHALGGTVPIAQVATAVLDLAVAAGIASWLRLRGGPSWPAWLYALHPLPALESAASAHLETGAIALVVLSLLAWQRGRGEAAAALGVAGIAFKLFPVLLVPPLLLRDAPSGSVVSPGSAASRLLAALGAGALVLLLALPVLDAGPALFTSLEAYGHHWSFNGLVFPLAEPWLGSSTRSVLFAAGGLASLLSWRFRPDPAAAWLAIGAAFVVLSPTVHPWYLLWPMVPALLCGRWGWAVASISLLGSYAVLATLDPATGTWTVPPWLGPITWGPAVLALLAEPLLRRRAEPGRGGSP